MFLTNLDTITLSLFLGSAVILVTLLGILLSFQFKYKEAKILLYLLFRLVFISIILLLVYVFVLLFRWPGIIDFSVLLLINIVNVWFYFRLFAVFCQFIKMPVILIGVILTIINFIIFTTQIIIDNNLFLLLSAFLSLLAVINLHFLALSVLIKFQEEPDYE